MDRFLFGDGEYRYFDYPLPSTVGGIREKLYARLVPLANQMMLDLRRDHRYPATLDEFHVSCREAGQTNATPLILKYDVGGHNRLHQDRYGSVYFPLQATILLSEPGRDFDGGHFMLVENRPRQQSKGDAVMLSKGEMIIFPSNERPVKSAKGFSRATVRHGVSTIEKGRRYALGVIFHDAA